MTTPKAAPAFQCYPADVLADCAGMTHAEFGMYWRLALLAWRELGLPTDLDQVARKLGLTRKALDRVWVVVGARFVERDGRLVLPWQEAEREKQAARRRAQSNNGKLGGRPRKKPDDNPIESDGFTNAKPDDSHAKPDESSSSSSSSSSSTTSPSSPRARASGAAEAAVGAQLLSDADRAALATVLDRVPHPETWAAEMKGSLDGMPGHYRVTLEQLGQVLRDFAGNGAMADPNLNHFRSYLRRSARAHTTAVSKATRPGTETTDIPPGNGYGQYFK